LTVLSILDVYIWFDIRVKDDKFGFDLILGVLVYWEMLENSCL
jgi:hypothetical protein